MTERLVLLIPGLIMYLSAVVVTELIAYNEFALFRYEEKYFIRMSATKKEKVSRSAALIL